MSSYSVARQRTAATSLRRTVPAKPDRLTPRSLRPTHAALGREMAGILAHALSQFRACPPELRAIQSVKTAAVARELLEDIGKAARLHTRWQTEAAYLDKDGHPRKIPMRGPRPSFEALCLECGLGDERDILLSAALQFGLSTRSGRNTLSHVSDVALLTGNSTLMLARGVLVIERFLRTVCHNAKVARTSGTSRGDITTQVRLSDEEFKRLSKDTRRFLGDFIEATDRRLLGAAARDQREKRPEAGNRWCGVTAFVFRD